MSGCTAHVRNGNYGYSIYEFQVYNVLNAAADRALYVNSSNPTLVMDNLLGLTWTRTIQTDTAARFAVHRRDCRSLLQEHQHAPSHRG